LSANTHLLLLAELGMAAVDQRFLSAG
jgi:hypothetical protein